MGEEWWPNRATCWSFSGARRGTGKCFTQLKLFIGIEREGIFKKSTWSQCAVGDGVAVGPGMWYGLGNGVLGEEDRASCSESRGELGTGAFGIAAELWDGSRSFRTECPASRCRRHPTLRVDCPPESLPCPLLPRGAVALLAPLGQREGDVCTG